MSYSTAPAIRFKTRYVRFDREVRHSVCFKFFVSLPSVLDCFASENRFACKSHFFIIFLIQVEDDPRSRRDTIYHIRLYLKQD